MRGYNNHYLAGWGKGGTSEPNIDSRLSGLEEEHFVSLPPFLGR